MRVMHSRRFFSLIAVCVVPALLAGCMNSPLARDGIAAKAKTQMIGMSKEGVLACMGIPKKKATEGATEVWSYLSTDEYSSSMGNILKATSFYSLRNSSRQKSFCTINVVMKNGAVAALHYLGPTNTTFLNDYDQCGYAVAACVQ